MYYVGEKYYPGITPLELVLLYALAPQKPIRGPLLSKRRIFITDLALHLLYLSIYD